MLGVLARVSYATGALEMLERLSVAKYLKRQRRWRRESIGLAEAILQTRNERERGTEVTGRASTLFCDEGKRASRVATQ
jgi:hypothetical protein